MRSCGRSAFSFIEVLALLLLVSVGLAAALGAFTYGLKLAGEAQARAIAMPTAVSLAIDRHLLLDPDLAAMWSAPAPYSFDQASATISDRGPVNGMFAIRNESTGPSDIIAKDGATVYVRTVQVDVDVYESNGGRLMASYSTRLVRQRGQP